MKAVILITILILYKLITGATGDADGDGKLTLNDCKAISNAVVKGNPAGLTVETADIDGDGQITILDAMRLHQHLGGIWQDPAGKLPVVPEINEAERTYLAGFDGLSEMYESMTPQEFINQHPVQPVYATGPDVTGSTYFKEINGVYGLSANQIESINRNGFVILPPENSNNGFGAVYRKIFKNDLPVYVSSDAILEPLFRSYDDILKEVETNHLFIQLSIILKKSLARLKTHKTANLGSALWQTPLQDVETYLLIAQALLRGQWTLTADVPVKMVGDSFLATIRAQKGLQAANFFGHYRNGPASHTIDWSQFKPRGHYECRDPSTTDCDISNYFRAMMWLGRADCAFRLDSLRHFRDFVLLHDCLAGSGAMSMLEKFNDIISFFVGEVDGFSPAGMSRFWSEYPNRPALADVLQSEATARAVMQKLSSKDYGNQFILSQAMWKTPGAPRPELPKTAQLSGQRFILDSYLLGRTVEAYVKVRSKPMLEEVSFCLGNNAAMDLLRDDIIRFTAVSPPPDQTYKPLHTRLGAARALFDAYPYWEKNLYTLWLDGLRTLSAPLPKTVAAAMRSRQWQDKQMNTQQASWAQLRHNTILYAKQSYTMGIICFYPDGYVEPYPGLYRRVGQIMARMGEKVSGFISDSKDYFENWKEVTDSLAAMAEQELKGLPLNQAQVAFLNTMLKKNPSMACGGPEYLGWYPKLFKGGWDGCVSAKPVIADVHTIPPSDYLPSNMVLHGATGAAQTMILHAHLEGADCGTVYAGPVFSYYQHDESPINRLTDSEWQEMVKKGGLKQPAWIEQYK